jgi:hypothetical protein
VVLEVLHHAVDPIAQDDAGVVGLLTLGWVGGAYGIAVGCKGEVWS